MGGATEIIMQSCHMTLWSSDEWLLVKAHFLFEFGSLPVGLSAFPVTCLLPDCALMVFITDSNQADGGRDISGLLTPAGPKASEPKRLRTWKTSSSSRMSSCMAPLLLLMVTAFTTFPSSGNTTSWMRRPKEENFKIKV